LIEGKGSPFLANIIGYCPPLLKSGALSWNFEAVLDRGTIVVEGLNIDSVVAILDENEKNGMLAELTPALKLDVLVR
jgi:hypothetical protein